jgi:hypothetical protein
MVEPTRDKGNFHGNSQRRNRPNLHKNGRGAVGRQVIETAAHPDAVLRIREYGVAAAARNHCNLCIFR